MSLTNFFLILDVQIVKMFKPSGCLIPFLKGVYHPNINKLIILLLINSEIIRGHIKEYKREKQYLLAKKENKIPIF